MRGEEERGRGSGEERGRGGSRGEGEREREEGEKEGSERWRVLRTWQSKCSIKLGLQQLSVCEHNNRNFS